MNVDDVSEMLEQVGLTADEARVYATLCRLGPAKAGHLAHEARLSRAQTYRVLEALEDRGIVSGDLGRPRVYRAAAVDSLMRHLNSSLEYRRHELRLLESELVQRLRRLAAGSDAPKRPHADILRGREVVVERIHALYEEAEKEVSLVLAHPGGLEMLESLGGWGRLLDRASRGIRVRLLVKRHARNSRFLAQARGAGGVEIREFTHPDDFGCVLVDGREAVVILTVDPRSYPRADRTRALATDATNFVPLLRFLFASAWSTAAAPAAVSAPDEETDEPDADGDVEESPPLRD